MRKFFNLIFDILENILNWGCDFWKSKLCNWMKLSALWGFIIIIIGSLCDSNITMNIGLGMCCGYILILLAIGLFVAVLLSMAALHGLLAYTERVACGKNEIFVLD